MSLPTIPAARPLSSFGTPASPSAASTPTKCLPAFQPAPLRLRPGDPSLQQESTVSGHGIPPDHLLRYVEGVDARFVGKLEKIAPGYILTVVGTILLALLVMTPVWDSTRLLYSSTHVYFLGRAWCVWTICFCCSIVFFYLIAMLLLERLGGQEVKTMPSYMYLFSTMITILGLGMLLLARPLRVDVHTAYHELMVSVNTGPRTEPLAAYFNVLLNMRLQPNCLNKTSVEQCSGFQDRYPYTAFLKQMELEYLCSGFGYEAVPQMPNGTKPLPAAVLLQHAGTKEEAINDYVGLLQYDRLTVVKDDMDGEAFSVVQITQDIQKRSRSPHKHVDMQGLFMLAASRNMSKSAAVWGSLTHGLGDTTQNMVATGWGNSYPPTLFTKANYKTTCEGAAARELLFSAGETSNLMYLEGTALLVFSLIVTMSRLFLLTCMGRERMEHATVAGPDGKQTKTVVL